jgi:hypothetical protein
MNGNNLVVITIVNASFLIEVVSFFEKKLRKCFWIIGFGNDESCSDVLWSDEEVDDDSLPSLFAETFFIFLKFELNI